MTALPFQVEDVGEPRAAEEVARELEAAQPVVAETPNGPTINGWPEDEIEQIGGLWQLPYEVLAMRFGDRWELSDKKAVKFAKRTVRILPPYEEIDEGTTRTAAIVGLMLLVLFDIAARVMLMRREQLAARQKEAPRGPAPTDRPQTSEDRPAGGGEARREDRVVPDQDVRERERDRDAAAEPGRLPGSAAHLAFEG